MALVVQNYFDLLSNEDGDNVVPEISFKKAPTPLSAGATKKNNKKQQAAKKKVIMQQPSKLVAQDHGTMKKQVINHRRPKQELKLEVARQDNQQKEEQVVETKLTLKEYEKELLERKQALNAVWKPDVERKVNLDEDFESMKLVHQKKVAEDYILAMPKKKEMSQDNGKHKVVIDMNGFLKPLRRRESKKHPLVANGGIVKAEAETQTQTTLSFKLDDVQFPALK